MNIKQIKTKLEEKKSYLEENFHIKEIGMFGSFIRGKQTEISDIDILVSFEKKHKNFFNYMRLKHYLKNLLGREVDLVIKEAVKPRLKERIFREVEYV